MVLLNGRLEVLVVEARGLPNLDDSLLNSSNKSDPYCVVSAEGVNGSRRIGKTFTIDDCLNPKWNFKIVVDLNQDVGGLKFVVKDKDTIGSETIGTCVLDVVLFSTRGRSYKGYLHLTTPKGKPAGSLRIQTLFSGTGTSMDAEASMMGRLKVSGQDMKSRFTYSSPKSKYIDYGQSEAKFLHGILNIYIDKAENLPNTDTSILSFKKKDVSDPFIDISLIDSSGDSWKVATSSVIENDLNPVWKQNFLVNVCHDIVAIKFTIKDKDVLSADTMGTINFSVQDIITSKGVEGTFALKNKVKIRKKSTVSLKIKFSPTSATLMPEVPDCLHPMRDLNHVNLYQDAHCLSLPAPVLAIGGNHFVNPAKRAWLDLYHLIVNAEDFIYIVGWSVNTKIALLRWENEDTRPLGQILLQKSREGVQVNILIWDELTSTEFNKAGAMNTCDEATVDFFKGTGVTVVQAPRERKSKDRLSTKESFTNFCYSHHQKCVIADAFCELSKKRKMVAFMGGLDLTTGRFDTPEHSLFSTLHTDHRTDFANNLVMTDAKYGPREPWHDIHCSIEGPIVNDLLSNFRERWTKQGSKKKTMTPLIENESKYHFLNKSQESWNVQLLRSINSDSAVFPRHIDVGLFVKKERIFENSIERGYIHQIRRSKRFIYIENQYFMGSSHSWLDSRDANITNLIPLEIATHIEDKIKANKRFVAYIVIPMFPEGKPSDKVIQEMLFWQFKTIEMMYKRVAEAIASARIDAHPQDYLLFLCLGKNEGTNPVPTPSELVGSAANSFKHRRLMIYVHSKMAIFDDEYIIVGSANINDRSMSGNRDTELAIGAFQPEYMSYSEGKLAEGEVSIFRKKLWSEHFGIEAPLKLDPSSLAGAHKVKKLAEEGLMSYSDIGRSPGIRHALIYPLDVHVTGVVGPRPDCPVFPDTTASTVGSRSAFIPTKLTS